MYTKDKLSRITLRLNQEQFDFVRKQAQTLGVSPSEFLRMMVNLGMSSSHASTELQRRTLEDMANRALTIAAQALQNNEQEESRRENETSVLDDNV